MTSVICDICGERLPFDIAANEPTKFKHRLSCDIMAIGSIEYQKVETSADGAITRSAHIDLCYGCKTAALRAWLMSAMQAFVPDVQFHH